MYMFQNQTSTVVYRTPGLGFHFDYINTIPYFKS